MKSIGLRAFSFVIVMVLATVACAVPSVSSIMNPMPHDDFSSDSTGWGTGNDSSSLVEYADSGLHMLVYVPFYVTWSNQGLKSFDNVHIEVSVKNKSTDPQALFGIVCDEQGSTQSFYYAGVSSDGYYAIIKSAVAQKDVFLKEGTSDVVSTASGSVRLGLDCGGGSLTLYVNGQKLDSVSDSTYSSGVIGLFTASDDAASGAEVTFDDFAVTKLGQ
jgi:hypothetical protein